MTTATPTKASLEDIEAVKDFPRRAAIAIAELDDMEAIAERLADAGYAGAEWLPGLYRDPESWTVNTTEAYLQRIDKAVSEFIAADGDLGRAEYNHWVIGEGMTVDRAFIEIAESGCGDDVPQRISALAAYAATQPSRPAFYDPEPRQEALPYISARLYQLKARVLALQGGPVDGAEWERLQAELQALDQGLEALQQ